MKIRSVFVVFALLALSAQTALCDLLLPMEHAKDVAAVRGGYGMQVSETAPADEAKNLVPLMKSCVEAQVQRILSHTPYADTKIELKTSPVNDIEMWYEFTATNPKGYEYHGLVLSTMTLSSAPNVDADPTGEITLYTASCRLAYVTNNPFAFELKNRRLDTVFQFR